MAEKRGSYHAIRTVNPSAWPQYPFDAVPPIPERSEPLYAIRAETDQRIKLRDGITLAIDVYRPQAPGERFPALLAFSPYTRQLQQTLVTTGQNEAGLTEFWVPRGYAHVIVDVRGSNESEGAWDMWGPTEQEDMVEVIHWAASQSWCNGRVGMVGCSYFAMTQLLAAEHRPEPLKAIFPYDAATDLYRDMFFHGGIPNEFARRWFADVAYLNLRSGRLKDPSGLHRHFDTILGLEYPLDGPYYWERSAWPRLKDIRIPTYFGCDWTFFDLHLRGAFEGWTACDQAPKRMLIGPEPEPRRPFAVYHQEALRWYDAWLKDMDTRVVEGDPIRLYIQGADVWRSEKEWPLARTQWRELYLGGKPGEKNGHLSEVAGPPSERSYRYEPADRRSLFGEPRLVYRTEPFSRPTEITGPLVLILHAASSAADTDFFVWLRDEAPDGSTRLLTRGWLRASHRALDEERSLPWRPWHRHDREEPLTPNEETVLHIEIWPTCNVFQAGHRLRLEIGSCDILAGEPLAFMRYNRAMPVPATNTVLEGPGKSRLLTPFIPH